MAAAQTPPSAKEAPSLPVHSDNTETDDNTLPVVEEDETPLASIMESVVRVTLAGLGGSIVGLSQEKRLESMRVVAGAAATAAARRRRSPASQVMNLPLTWAFSCMAFCAVVETSRRTSPSTMIWNYALDSPFLATSSDSSSVGTSTIRKSAVTVADYTIGGAIGGLAGAFGRRFQLRKRLPSAMLRGSQTFFGVVPGIALGLAAGVLQASTDLGLEYAERAAQENSASE